jgi:hypothetical protein
MNVIVEWSAKINRRRCGRGKDAKGLIGLKYAT